jgi:hypothetical protein
MIFNNRVEQKLGLRYFQGGTSGGNNSSKGSSTSTSGGVSQSLSGAQLTPDQLLSLYNTALPTMLSTASTASNSIPTSSALTAANTGATNAVNAINTNGLSPGEYNATERSLNNSNLSTGNLGVTNGTNTIANAMNFGGAFNSKIPLLNNAASTAAGVANAGSNALGATTGVFNPIASNATANSSISNSMYGSNSVSKNMSKGSTDSAQGGICFLTTACCKHKGLQDNCKELTVLRHFRDTYVPKVLVQEYYELAPTIEPKVRDNVFVLESIYNTVCKCVEDIEQGNKESALNRYISMVTELKQI